MKRAEALQPLSRAHHAALIVAKGLREAVEVEAGRRSMLDFWEPAGREHFRIEEEVLLPRWAAAGPIERDVAMRFFEEHLDLRTRILALAEADVSLSDLHELGARLHDHVRFEERELFPLIEAALDESELSELGAAIAGGA